MSLHLNTLSGTTERYAVYRVQITESKYWLDACKRNTRLRWLRKVVVIVTAILDLVSCTPRGTLKLHYSYSQTLAHCYMLPKRHGIIGHEEQLKHDT